MIGVLLISHGKMAEGMEDSLRLIMGVPEKLDTASLTAGQAIETLRKDVAEKVHALDDGDGVLIFVDLYGASPFNTAKYVAMKDGKTKIGIVAGMNLPMVMDALLSRSNYANIDALVDGMIQSGRNAIAKPAAVTDDDHDDY